MRVSTLYDSNYNEITPLNNLVCYLVPTYNSVELAKRLNLPLDQMLFKCILTELPQIHMNYTWDTGATAALSFPLDAIAGKDDNSIVKRIIETFASENYVSMSKTGPYSQIVMHKASILSLSLKFRILADSYNYRDRLDCSQYEEWLKILAKAVMPIQAYNFRGAAKNIEHAIRSATSVDGAGRNFIADTWNSTKNIASNAVDALPLIGNDENTGAAGKVLEGLQTLAGQIDKFVMAGSKRGALTFFLGIGEQHDNTTEANLAANDLKKINHSFGKTIINCSSKVDWIIKSFNATPARNFLPSTHGPKPIYMDFDVNLETNQVLTREQFIEVLGLTGRIAALQKQKEPTVQA